MSEQNKPEILKMELEALSKNEEFARVAVAVFMARLNPTLEEVDDVKTAVSEAVTNAVIHGYQGKGGIIYLEVEIDGLEISVTVKDTGIGIPKKHQERIFERFYRVDKSRSKSTGGTGLGLAIVKHIVAQHSAELTLKSEEGKGTEITVLF